MDKTLVNIAVHHSETESYYNTTFSKQLNKVYSLVVR